MICKTCGKEMRRGIHRFVIKKRGIDVCICDECFHEWSKVYDREELWRIENFDKYDGVFEWWLDKKLKERREKEKVKLILT